MHLLCLVHLYFQVYQVDHELQEIQVGLLSPHYQYYLFLQDNHPFPVGLVDLSLQELHFSQVHLSFELTIDLFC